MFIHYLEGHPTYAPILDSLFDGWESGEMRGMASVLVVAETLVGSFRSGARVEAEDAVQWLSGLRGLDLVPITLEVAVRAAEVRARYGIPMADSLHAASAIVRNADIFLTNDRTFARLEEFEPVFLDDYC